MNRIAYSLAHGTTLLAAGLAASLLGAADARAEGPIVSAPTTPFVSTRSRAEVRAEVINNREAVSAAGTEWALNQHTFQPGPGGPTRAQVAAEYIGAREEVHARTGEDSGSAYLGSPAAGMPGGTMLAANTYR